MFAQRLEGCLTTELEKRLALLMAPVGDVDTVVLGLPLRLDGTDTDSTAAVRAFAERFAQVYPLIALHWADERFTSKLAAASLVEAGVPKHRRRDKLLLDSQSATLILQAWLESPANSHR
jgi:putative Holliday junction resolvase